MSHLLASSGREKDTRHRKKILNSESQIWIMEDTKGARLCINSGDFAILSAANWLDIKASNKPQCFQLQKQFFFLRFFLTVVYNRMQTVGRYASEKERKQL